MARVKDFVQNVLRKGFSYVNDYTFSFEAPAGTTQTKNVNEPLNIKDELAKAGFYRQPGNSIFQNESRIDYLKLTDEPGDKLRVLCEEISLPGVSSATGQARGINQGVDFKYAHTKLYNDLSITFICDKDLTPLRFFQVWHSFIYEGKSPTASNQAYTNRLYYDYCLNMYIQKNEVKSPTPIAQNAYYKLINAYPTSISSIPLNSGASSITRVTVNLAYERWIFKAPNLSPTDWTS